MAERPAGTVTFLFTDIEGSTRLLKALRDDYATVLAAHAGLLREAFARHGGQVVDTQGDSFFVAFPRPKGAVAAAVEAQRALAAHAWPDGARVRVRMGIHTGEAALADGRYVGVAVHRAARIGAAGHGGQILISQITHDLLHDEEAELDDVRIDDLGEQRLKDLDRSVRLYQVLAPGVDGEFPPLRTADSPATPEATRPRSRRLAVAAAATAVAAAAAVLAVVLIARDGEADAGISAAPLSLVAVDPDTGERVAGEELGQRVTRLVPGAGSLWALSPDEERVYRLDQRSGDVEEFFQTGPDPVDLVADGRFLWLSHPGGLRLTRIDQRRRLPHESVTLDLGAESTSEPQLELAAGAVWMTRTTADRHPSLVRVDVRTLEAEPIRLPPDAPAGDAAEDLAFGLGELWVSGESVVWRVDAATRRVEATIAVPGREGSGPLCFAEDVLYVLDAETAVGLSLDSSRVWFVSPFHDAAAGPLDVPAQPRAVTADGERAWIAHAGERPSLSSVHARPEPSVGEQITLSREPLALAIAGGRLWVSVD